MPPPPPGLTGVAIEPVRELGVGALTAWVGTVVGGADRTLEVARRHDAVVRAALRDGITPLPARGGQLFADDATLEAELARRGSDLLSTLAVLAGSVEMTVHFELDAPEDAAAPGRPRPTGPAGEDAKASSTRPERQHESKARGRAYLERVRERMSLEHFVQADVATIRSAVAQAVAGLARAEAISMRWETETRRRLAISHLVARGDVESYRAAIARLAPVSRATAPKVDGPHPPYSFARLPDD